MNKLVVLEYWNTESFPYHYSFRVNCYRDQKFPSTGLACDSKKEAVAYIDGLQQAFNIHGEKCEIECRTSDGTVIDYCEHFLGNNEYVEYGSSRGDREDFHSDG